MLNLQGAPNRLLPVIDRHGGGESFKSPVYCTDNVISYIQTKIRQGGSPMTAKEELLKYITELTQEKVDALIDRLPLLLSELEALGLPVHLIEPLQTE